MTRSFEAARRQHDDVATGSIVDVDQTDRGVVDRHHRLSSVGEELVESARLAQRPRNAASALEDERTPVHRH
jgi:hypothetical protein